MMPNHIGHRDNPAECLQPGDLDRAVGRAWDPTPGQASAGNYKMAHVIVAGLRITIETPKGRARSGVGPNGTTWSVRMPAHYGYCKQTEGADGDHVDVYIGDHAHIAHTLPVWVVDQCDAESRAFDEHKVMIGFIDSPTARKTYYAAFSDGKGPKRVGGVARMTMEQFKTWLKSENTKLPLVMKSALVKLNSASYGAPSCRCESVCGCTESNGGYMTTQNVAGDSTATGIGKILSILQKGFSGLNATQQQELLAEAALMSRAGVSKASEFMEHPKELNPIGHVQDQWSGPPDDTLDIVHAHGPGSTVPSGDINVGPSQMSSGNGAIRMESQYGRPTPTAGVQAATERLGRELMSVKSAMKSMLESMTAQNVQIEMLMAKSATTATPEMITDAVAKALADIPAIVTKAVNKAVAKAREDSEDGSAIAVNVEGEDDDEAHDDVGKGEGFDKDVEDDDEGKSEKAKQAAMLRQLAKGFAKWASRRVAQAEEMIEVGKPKAAARRMDFAVSNLAKAQSFLTTAKSLNGGEGEGTQFVAGLIAKAEKKIKQPSVEMQTVWPMSTPTAVKSDAPAAVAPTAPSVDPASLAKTLAEMKKAADGMAMLQTNMAGLMQVMAGGSRGATGLPPAAELVKSDISNGDSLTVENELQQMATSNVIDLDSLDRAREVLTMMKSNGAIPQTFIEAKLGRLPQDVQVVLRRKMQAAA